MPITNRIRCAALAAFAALLTSAQAAPPEQLLADYRRQAGAAAAAAAAAPERGQALFTTRQGGEWSCASCHGAVPTQPGRHAATGKPIAPLAPAFNPQRFTDPAKAEKWFRRNCKDVMSRECTPAEKADILGWLLGLKP